jgi:hypothetical protein
MATAAAEDWLTLNQNHLTSSLARIRALLERHAAQGGSRVEADEDDSESVPEVGGRGSCRAAHAVKTGSAGASPSQDTPLRNRLSDPARGPSREAPPGSPPYAIDSLSAAFGLSPFERDVLLLCAGPEFQDAFGRACAAAQGDPSRTYPTFGLALAALPEAHWSALSPRGPLRFWQLIEVGRGPSLTSAPLRIDERILHELAGVSSIDERVGALIEPLSPSLAATLAPSQAAEAEKVARLWSRSGGSGSVPTIVLCGPDVAAARAVAAAACELAGLRAAALPADQIPAAAADQDILARLADRETTLGGLVLLIEVDDHEATDAARSNAVARFLARSRAPTFVSVREARAFGSRRSVRFDIPLPDSAEQRAAWSRAMGPLAAAMDGQIDAIVGHFRLGGADIHAAVAEVLASGVLGEGDADGRALGKAFWAVCRKRCRVRLDGLAQRIEPRAGWDDLVLPDAQKRLLRDIAIHLRHRTTVYERWGFATRDSRGLGITALFSGASGTGKTMAAEVLANELLLDLYRIDLSSVVSKYIGETEKNLRRVFDAAEHSGAILLFDEADALFGKRSEVKDSHDRYANIEVSYLLQRMEAYRGLAVLTTNLKNALDPAFLRRIRFVVQFPFPDAPRRGEIWRRAFPAPTPTEGLNPARLASLNIPGGNIRNIALNAAFLAAEAGEPVRMGHLLEAARIEYAKLERPLTDAEIGGWG